MRDEASAFVAELEANLRHASVALRASLHGGGTGALALAARDFLFRGAPRISSNPNPNPRLGSCNRLTLTLTLG